MKAEAVTRYRYRGLKRGRPVVEKLRGCYTKHEEEDGTFVYCVGADARWLYKEEVFRTPKAAACANAKGLEAAIRREERWIAKAKRTIQMMGEDPLVVEPE